MLFVATGAALDEEMRQRIEEHQRRRPPAWRTMEIPLDVGSKLAGAISDAEVVLLDCLTLLVSNIMGECAEEDLEKADCSLVEERLISELQSLMECIDDTSGTFIIVSNEVGMGLVPMNRAGRLYRDLLGRANQMLAQKADEVYFMFGGIPLEVKGLAGGGHAG